MSGPLAGVAVLELGGIGPAPFAGMVLADLGADVLRIDRADPPGYPGTPRHDLLHRGKRSAVLDLHRREGTAAALALAGRAEVLLEGFRPGVAERLGLGPEPCLARHPRLVYGRMTGWGQTGPLAKTAGHDLTYLAVAGVLHRLGPAGAPPAPPANLLGDYGGGGMLLVTGVLAALWRAGRTGAGQVVDAAVIDGAALLTTQLYGLQADGLWGGDRGRNLLDGGAPCYAVYPTADGEYVAVAALEPAFFAQLLAGLDLDPAAVPAQSDVAQWPRLRHLIGERLASRTRDEWAEAFAGTDACLAPVLTPAEAAAHPQLASRAVIVERYGVAQPAPAPRFSASPAGGPVRPPPLAGEHTRSALAEWGVPDVAGLLASGVAVQAGVGGTPGARPAAEGGKMES